MYDHTIVGYTEFLSSALAPGSIQAGGLGGGSVAPLELPTLVALRLMSRFSEIPSSEKSTRSSGAVGSERHLTRREPGVPRAGSGVSRLRSPVRSASRSLPVAPPCARLLALGSYVTNDLKEVFSAQQIPYVCRRPENCPYYQLSFRCGFVAE